MPMQTLDYLPFSVTITVTVAISSIFVFQVFQLFVAVRVSAVAGILRVYISTLVSIRVSVSSGVPA